MSENYGKFSGNPKTEWLTHPTNPDRDMKLLEDFWYIDPDGKKWLAPAGSIINGASIPRPLWSIVGSPYTDDYRNASVVHDVAYDDESIEHKEADKMFYYACLAGGCSEDQAEQLYLGVRIGAWASKLGDLFSFSREEMLFRKPGEQTKGEKQIEAKFRDLANKVKGKKKKLAFHELEKLVDKALAE